MEKLKKLLRNIRYAPGFNKRVAEIGFFNTVREWIKYYKRYSKLPKIINKNSPFKYKLFVWHNYLRIVYYMPDISKEKVPKIVPKYFAKNILADKTNPMSEKFKLVNKIEFYRILEANKIPYPKLYFYSYGGRYYSINGEKIKKLDNYFGQKMFVKDIDGSSGNGADLIVFDKNFLENTNNNLIFQSFIVPEKNIKKIAPVTATATLRINSYLDKNDEVELCSAFIKFPIEGAISDNMDAGSIGVEILLNSGMLNKNGITSKGSFDKNGQKIIAHPVSNMKFHNFKIPFWKDTIVLLKTLHKIFYNLKFIGWDIAITDNGPMVIEGNSVGDVLFEQLISESYFDKKYIQENIL